MVVIWVVVEQCLFGWWMSGGSLSVDRVVVICVVIKWCFFG